MPRFSVLRSRFTLLLLLLLCTIAAQAQIKTTPITSGRIPLHDKFEAKIAVSTAAPDRYWPYDAAPPAGIPAGTGVSVDALLTDPKGKARVAPCYWFEDVNTGEGAFRLRFAPDKTGTWTYRIRVRDAQRESLSARAAFTCVSSGHPGYLRVSPTDSRYFEHSNGTVFLPAPGVHQHRQDPQGIASLAGRFTLCRIWAQASEGMCISSMRGQGGSAWSQGSPSDIAPPGQLRSWRLTPRQSAEIAGNPDAVVGARYRLECLTRDGDRVTPDLAYVSRRTAVQNRPSADPGWVWRSIEFTADHVGTFRNYVQFRNDGTADAIIAEASLRRIDGQGNTFGPQVLVVPSPDVLRRYSHFHSARLDRAIEAAANAEVYLKIVLFEKGDSVGGSFGPRGELVAPNGGPSFYGTSDNQASRWLQAAYARYFAARWGWSPHVFSAEYVNEGDPHNGNHFAAAANVARSLNNSSSRPILAATSAWHSQSNLWNHYPELSYVDVHQYLGANIRYGWSHGGIATEPGDPTVLGVPDASANRALRINSTNSSGLVYSAFFDPVPVQAGHVYRLRYKVRAENIDNPTGPPAYGGGGSGLQTWILDSPRGGYNLNNDVNAANKTLPNGNSNWVEVIGANKTIPAGGRWLAVRPHTAYMTGQVFFDDIRLENVTTGKIYPIPNGDFEHSLPLWEDSALVPVYAWQTYAGGGGSLPRGVSRPWLWGETGFGYHPRIAEDRDFVWLHKLTWASVNPGAVYLLEWTNAALDAPEGSLLAYRRFLADVPLANGRYKDAEPVCTAGLRAWGQVDPVARRAHLWVDNPDHTWERSVAGETPTTRTGAVSVQGLPGGVYTVEAWDTRTGTIQGVQRLTVTGGQLTIPVVVTTDVAFKVRP